MLSAEKLLSLHYCNLLRGLLSKNQSICRLLLLLTHRRHQLKRLIRNVIRLRKRMDELDTVTYQQRCRRIEKRLQLILEHGWSNKEAKRLLKRLNRHRDDLFTFLHNEDVPYDNNLTNVVFAVR